MLILKPMSLVNTQYAFMSLGANTSAYIKKAVDTVSECNDKHNIEKIFMKKRNTDNTDAGENITISMVFTRANNCSPHMKMLGHVLKNTNPAESIFKTLFSDVQNIYESE